MIFECGAEHDGMSVLHILRDVLRLSRGVIKYLKFKEDGIVLRGERVTVRKILRAGDILVLGIEDSTPTDIEPKDLPIDIAYEDEEIVVPIKPPFMPTHPSIAHHDDTVANALCYRYRHKDTPFVFRPVNRLDRNTSGLLIIARNRISAGKLYRSMREGKIKKRYIAILRGTLTQERGVIEGYIRRVPDSIIEREVCLEGEGGDFALTEYEVIDSRDGYTLVYAVPRTGRTHQLRVHFASLGAHILGDELYGEESELIARHALHAYELSFAHPTKDQTLTLRAPIPSDMESVIDKIFRGK